jgi:hypothetical protein
VVATLALLLVALVSHPALAGPEDPRVIAVHTASAPRVSLVLALPTAQSEVGLAAEAVSVRVNGTPVTTRVTPMASRSLSVALVIDTSSDLTAEALEAVQSGATEFLLRLPEGVRTMVVASGGDPRVVAPLSAEPADALSAISALHSAGTRATTPGTLLAAEELAMAPPGPHAIVVYTHGSDQRGRSVEQVTQAVARAEAVVNVVQTGGDDLWSQVVGRTGGAVLRTATAEVVQSYGRLATALGEQYLVAFQAPGELPAAAEVTVKTGDEQSRTTVALPVAGTPTDPAEPPSERSPAGRALVPISIVLTGLVLIALALLALNRRARRQPSVHTGTPDAGGNRSAPPSPRGRRPAKRPTERPAKRPADRASCPTRATSVPARVVLCRAGTEVGSLRPRLAAPTTSAAAPAARPATATFARRQPPKTTRARSCPSTSGGQDERRATAIDIAIGHQVGDGGGGRRSRRGRALG